MDTDFEQDSASDGGDSTEKSEEYRRLMEEISEFDRTFAELKKNSDEVIASAKRLLDELRTIDRAMISGFEDQKRRLHAAHLCLWWTFRVVQHAPVTPDCAMVAVELLEFCVKQWETGSLVAYVAPLLRATSGFKGVRGDVAVLLWFIEGESHRHARNDQAALTCFTEALPGPWWKFWKRGHPKAHLRCGEAAYHLRQFALAQHHFEAFLARGVKDQDTLRAWSGRAKALVAQGRPKGTLLLEEAARCRPADGLLQQFMWTLNAEGKWLDIRTKP